MHPDAQLEHDTIIITLGFIAFALIAFLITYEHGGLDPIDRCANATIDTLSPYQIQQLTGSPMPTDYHYVRHWCTQTIEYEHKIRIARTCPLYPLNDMMID